VNPARVDFVTLRLFCAVAQTGSITKGASRCHLALSAASRRLADFEEAVGSVLLERTAQGVRLTPAGHVAMQHAMRLSQGFDLFGAELAEYAQGYRGHVRLWANMSALTEFLPDVLAGFMVRHPEIKVEIEEQLSGDIARALVDGVADIGVFADGTPVDGLSVRLFQTDELVLICAADHELARRDAVADDLLDLVVEGDDPVFPTPWGCRRVMHSAIRRFRHCDEHNNSAFRDCLVLLS